MINSLLNKSCPCKPTEQFTYCIYQIFALCYSRYRFGIGNYVIVQGWFIMKCFFLALFLRLDSKDFVKDLKNFARCHPVPWIQECSML